MQRQAVGLDGADHFFGDEGANGFIEDHHRLAGGMPQRGGCQCRYFLDCASAHADHGDGNGQLAAIHFHHLASHSSGIQIQEFFHTYLLHADSFITAFVINRFNCISNQTPAKAGAAC